ncbi:hypothetical protein QL919_06900 [Psychrobacter sp. APC 3426]|uniref:hypothetical protein n=1 Tax=Psychrobacter sp. APC 3426 TaxID=3035177 RepID=UPI0025B31B07|nr:hypothetical protein [Psychrobacter sp. APC 3426]MDN3398452.1 hypothetical protein [Psychrobacter sp. APC 3426]
MTTQNWLSELLDDIATLSQNSSLKIDMNKFRAVHSSTSHQTLDKDQLAVKVQEINNVSGWVQATGEVKTLDNETIVVSSPLLNGEWVEGDAQADTQTSYVLEYIGNNKWMLQQCVLDFTDTKPANSLAERVIHKEVGVKNTRNLIYQKLWIYKDTAAVADMAFFVGFDS